MIGHAADLDGRHVILPGDAAQKRPEPLAQCGVDEGTPFFGAENTMLIGTDVRHGVIQPSPPGQTWRALHANAAILIRAAFWEPASAVPSGLRTPPPRRPQRSKRWAIVRCPSGTRTASRPRASSNGPWAGPGRCLPQHAQGPARTFRTREAGARACCRLKPFEQRKPATC